MHTKPLLITIFLILTLVVGRELRAQIVFDDIRPETTPVPTNIRPKKISTAPLEGMAAPSKISAPMPKFQQSVIRPTPLSTAPTISRTNIQPNTIRENNHQITFNPMTKNHIRPREIAKDPIIATVEPGEKIEKAAPIENPHWTFNPVMQNRQPSSIRYDTSIRLPMADYDSPYRQDIRPPRVVHPMLW